MRLACFFREETQMINYDQPNLENQTDRQYISRSGYYFNYNDTVWCLGKDKDLTLDWLPLFLEEKLIFSCKKSFLYFAEHHAPSYCVLLAYNLRLFFEFCLKNDKKKINIITGTHILNYFSFLDKKEKYKLGHALPLIKKWLELGYEGVSEDIEDACNMIRIKGPEAGKAVKTLCPYKGPLSDLEYENYFGALASAFEAGNISLQDMFLSKLFLATGRRPAQISHLKIKDYLGVSTIDGQSFHIIRVPMVKQRTQWRVKFNDCALSIETGMIAEKYIENLKSEIKCIASLNNNILEEIPLFPDWKVLRNQIDRNDHLALHHALSADICHASPANLGKKVEEISKSLEILSERTGEILKVTPIRIRRTLATRAAREGYGILVIAKLLDHADTQNAHIYTENTPEHLTNIDKAMAMQLGPISQAFAGTLVVDETKAKRGNDLSSRIRSPVSSDGVGTCGNHSFCSALAPIACYTCIHFQPWLEGPHEEILDNLLKKRSSIIKRTQDKTIASVNDRTIFAISEVITLCKNKKNLTSKMLEEGGNV